MSDRQLTFWCAIVCGALAYLLPLAMWVKRKSAIRTELFAVPALFVGSWWFAETFDLPHLGRFGFTFYGALPAAVISNVLILVLLHLRTSPQRPFFWGAMVAAISILGGLALHLLLPGIPE
jgi:hypothetical protein